MCDCKESKGFTTTVVEKLENKETRSAIITTGLITFFIGLFIGAACSSGSYPETVHYHST